MSCIDSYQETHARLSIVCNILHTSYESNKLENMAVK